MHELSISARSRQSVLIPLINDDFYFGVLVGEEQVFVLLQLHKLSYLVNGYFSAFVIERSDECESEIGALHVYIRTRGGSLCIDNDNVASGRTILSFPSGLSVGATHAWLGTKTTLPTTYPAS